MFDKENKQDEYQYMAKDMSGKYVIGYIVIDKPWYSNEANWTYYIVSNEYGSGGICGGATDLGFKKVICDSDTIEPYTQIAKIKYNQSIGMSTRLIKEYDLFKDKKDNEIITIKASDEIPYYLWEK